MNRYLCTVVATVLLGCSSPELPIDAGKEPVRKEGISLVVLDSVEAVHRYAQKHDARLWDIYIRAAKPILVGSYAEAEGFEAATSPHYFDYDAENNSLNTPFYCEAVRVR